jgi:hypothetical protein
MDSGEGLEARKSSVETKDVYRLKQVDVCPMLFVLVKMR